MKPDFYKDYVDYMDYINDMGIAFTHIALLSKLLKFIGKKDKLVDVGGGTGLFAKHILYNKPDVSITFVEPSAEMLERGKERLCETVKYINLSLEESLPIIPEEQNAFLFLRSLYAIANSTTLAIDYFKKIRQKLTMGGRILIYDISGIRDSDLEFKEQLRSLKVNTKEDEEKFEYYWKMFEIMTDLFNEGVKSGAFKIFSEEDLKEISREAGFNLLLYEKHGSRFIAVMESAG